MWEGTKKEEVTEAVSFRGRGGPKISTQLSPLNWSESRFLFTPPVCEIRCLNLVQWLEGFPLFFFSRANSRFKVPFCIDIFRPDYHTNITPNQTHIYPQSAIDISQRRDKTVINHPHDSDLSFRSDSSGAVPSPGWVRRHMSAVIDSSQFCQLAAGELQGKIRTSICVVPNGRLGSREGPLQPWWYLYLVGLGLLLLQHLSPADLWTLTDPFHTPGSIYMISYC